MISEVNNFPNFKSPKQDFGDYKIIMYFKIQKKSFSAYAIIKYLHTILKYIMILYKKRQTDFSNLGLNTNDWLD